MLIPKAEKRIAQYLDFLEKNAYQKITSLEFEIFKADKIYRSPPENAEWQKIAIPAHWGKEWTCFWFRTVYQAPSGESPVFISITPNADCLAFIDNVPVGAFNMCHNKIRVDADGKEHTLHIEAYAGHRHCGSGPFENQSVFVCFSKSIASYPNTFEGGSLLERRQAVHSLFYDARALFETAQSADPNSLRRAKILKGLSGALGEISFNADGKELERQAAAAAQRIAPLLAMKNSPTVPSMHLVGHAHIDHAWLWPIEETERKVARTFINMTRFAKEYPEFIFLQSQPCQLEIIKNEYPSIFSEVKKAYQNGNWEPNGGMWVESDCNIPSGESLIRQFLVGKKINKELLGYEADTLWLPDVFGYAASLPQIMAGCRIKYFVTSKISWNDTTRFPYETFIWRGIDGTGIKAHFISSGYNGKVLPGDLNDMWNSVQHKEVQSACVKPIGEGDGGGGTFRADLEMARRLGDLEGAPRAAWKKVSNALDEIFSSDESEFPEWHGELYLELHRGTYTTQARTKRNNRLLEFALRSAEFLCAFAAIENKGSRESGNWEMLLDCWKHTLTYQFHDIIPGSSIGRVYAEAEADSANMLARLAGLIGETKKNLAGIEGSQAENIAGGVTVFNDLSWERTGAVGISSEQAASVTALADGDGKIYPLQRYLDFDGKSRAVFAAKAPSLGWARYRIAEGSASAQSPFAWQDNILETPFYKITFNADGRIASLIDKSRGCETVAPGGAFNAFITAEDVPVYWDAWDIDADWIRNIMQETQLVSMGVATDGPVCFRLRFAYEIGAASRFVQDMVCYADNPRIDFETKISWNEKRRLLKVEFDTNINATQVRCEVQYGHLWRNTHRNLMQDRAKFEICAHKWIAVEEEGSSPVGAVSPVGGASPVGGGIALMNDCKYGHDVSGGKMRLTLLRSPCAPDPNADQGLHYFTYSILPFAGSFGSANVIRSAYELNSPVTAVFGSGSSSALPASSLCSVDGSAVIIGCVKLPEDGAADEIILRLYESLGGQCRTAVHFSRDLKSAAETDMLEDNPRPLPVQGRSLNLEFRPFEIKTLRIKVKS